MTELSLPLRGSAAVLAVIDSEPTRLRDIRTKSQLPLNLCGAHLSLLVKQGVVERVKRGWYKRTQPTL